ncbi:hypothetical protein BJP37_29100 [Moorena bouillonii PNG]|uniref:Uncharacterized protein n=1 Tax=Moorena bouillonii PNG TaxID=568701 RepID=A0A1U7NC89_9CYAN|nr:hypothetical protein BJP37_29100 [Moorena bouillonii PNG]
MQNPNLKIQNYVSYQLSAISYQLSAISYQLSAISYQLSAISYQYLAYALGHRLEACATLLNKIS